MVPRTEHLAVADDLKALQAELGANKVQMASLQNRFRDMLDCSKTSLKCIVELSDLAAEEVNSLKAKIDADTKEALISRNMKEEEISKLHGALQVPLCGHTTMKRCMS